MTNPVTHKCHACGKTIQVKLPSSKFNVHRVPRSPDTDGPASDCPGSSQAWWKVAAKWSPEGVRYPG